LLDSHLCQFAILVGFLDVRREAVFPDAATAMSRSSHFIAEVI
jgi:hypothetical protein